MHRSIHDLGIDRLNVADRIALVQDIWDSVAEAVQNTAPSAAEIAELNLRLADDDAQPESAIDWQEIRSTALRKWSQS